MIIPYASAFVTYLLTKIKNIHLVERIILYGSVARDEATSESDVDLFLEVKKKKKTFERER